MLEHKKDSNFVWAELSSYEPKSTMKFYQELFGWKYYDQGLAKQSPNDQFGMSDVKYNIATLGNEAKSGLFDMPAFFKKIKMPPFWMSYLTVDDIDSVVAKAKEERVERAPRAPRPEVEAEAKAEA